MKRIYASRKGVQKYCSKACSRKAFSEIQREMHEGNKNSFWKGYMVMRGYIFINLNALTEEDRKLARPMALKGKLAKYVAEHRLVMAKHLGRSLKHDEVVHHNEWCS